MQVCMLFQLDVQGNVFDSMGIEAVEMDWEDGKLQNDIMQVDVNWKVSWEAIHFWTEDINSIIFRKLRVFDANLMVLNAARKYFWTIGKDILLFLCCKFHYWILIRIGRQFQPVELADVDLAVNWQTTLAWCHDHLHDRMLIQIILHAKVKAWVFPTAFAVI